VNILLHGFVESWQNNLLLYNTFDEVGKSCFASTAECLLT